MRKAMIFGLALAGIALALPEPAAAGSRWGNLSKENCVSNSLSTNGCFRRHNAILWDIPWGQNWEAACKNTPHPNPVFGLPRYCTNNGLNMWGKWDFKNDPTCGSWCGTTYVKAP